MYDKDILIIVWDTINMQPSYEGRTWTLISTNDEAFTWIVKEHCLLLVSYNKDNYYFNGPYNNNGLVSYDKEIAELRYKELGSQSLAILQ